jgi:predicted phage tail protein
MRTIVLHGELGALYGKRFTLDVRDVAEAVRALSSQIKGLRRYIADRTWRVVIHEKGKKPRPVSEETLHLGLSKGDIHIIPAVEGAKKGMGIAKIILGVLLIAVAFWAAPALGAAGGLLGGLGISPATLGMVGLGLIANGISSLLAPKPPKKQEPTQDQSFMFSGQLNTTEQGGPVPVVYGICRSGSVLVSAGVAVDDFAITHIDPFGGSGGSSGKK